MANPPSAPSGSRPLPRAVLLTGASGGVGTVATRALADHGFHVFAGVRNPDAYRSPSPQVTPVRMDVTDPDDVAAAAESVAEATGGELYAVVNNAGIIVQGPLELVPPAELQRQFAVNVHGPALVTQAFLPLLRRGRGRLVNVSAPTARVPAPFFGPIGASKAALQALTHALRVELARWDIPVVILEPGAMRTEIFAVAEEAQAKATATLRKDQIELYAAQLAAIGATASTMRMSPPQIMADAILTSLTAARPKARYTVGRDTRLIGLLSRLPLRTQDRLISGVLGLNKVQKAGRNGT